MSKSREKTDDSDQFIELVRDKLRHNESEAVRIKSQKYFKGGVPAYGVPMPVVHKISAEFYEFLKNLTKPELFSLCEKFWESGFLEESLVACDWIYRRRKNFDTGDFHTFQRWVENYVNNWATCDSFCNHSVGSLLLKNPKLTEVLINDWTRSENRWVRRGAAVSLIVPARKGLLLTESLEIAARLLTDSDDMVQKGYGWLLKNQAEKYLDEVFDFILNNKKQMPRTALRYAIEKMPESLKQEAMSR